MKKSLLLLTILLVMAGISCQKKDKAPEEYAELNIGLMPAVDIVPFFAAQHLGFFEEAGLTVKFNVFFNAQDRQSALQTNQIDGAMTDLIAVAVNNSAGFSLKATTLTDGMFPILANEEALNKDEISVGMMEVSVSNFLVDHWLGQDRTVNKVFINAIPGRLEAVAAGQIDMALLPEPIASAGELKGLTKLVFEMVDGFSPDVMAFTEKALEEKEDEIIAFHKALQKGVKAVQNDPELKKVILAEYLPNYNPALADHITFPKYNDPTLPNQEYLQKVIDWSGTVTGSPLNIQPTDLIDDRFIKAAQ